jgi:hypothetical protein
MGEVVPVLAMKAYQALELQLHALLTSVLDGGDWSVSCFLFFWDMMLYTVVRSYLLL